MPRLKPPWGAEAPQGGFFGGGRAGAQALPPGAGRQKRAHLWFREFSLNQRWAPALRAFSEAKGAQNAVQAESRRAVKKRTAEKADKKSRALNSARSFKCLIFVFFK